MIIDGKKLANSITTHLKKEIEEGIAKGWEAPKLVIFSVKPNDEISTYVQNKQKKDVYKRQVQGIVQTEMNKFFDQSFEEQPGLSLIHI